MTCPIAPPSYNTAIYLVLRVRGTMRVPWKQHRSPRQQLDAEVVALGNVEPRERRYVGIVVHEVGDDLLLNLTRTLPHSLQVQWKDVQLTCSEKHCKLYCTQYYNVYSTQYCKMYGTQ